MLDLISTTEDSHYENYRLEQMETRKFGEARVKKPDNPKFKEEEEALRKRFTEQVKAEEARFRQWEQHVRFHVWIKFGANFLSSLLPSVIVSIKTLRSPTALSSPSKPSWITCKSDIVALNEPGKGGDLDIWLKILSCHLRFSSGVILVQSIPSNSVTSTRLNIPYPSSSSWIRYQTLISHSFPQYILVIRNLFDRKL
jgi:hypothetical protein